MQSIPLKSRLIQPRDDLFQVIVETLKCHRETLQEGDVLAVVSKAVSYAEDRLVDLNRRSFQSWVKKEADQVLDPEIGLTLKNRSFVPNAGIDKSNAPKGKAILWPIDSFASARSLCHQLERRFKIKKLGVLIVDSTLQPLRAGSVGRAIGWAGFFGVEDLRGTKDLYGNTMRITQKAVADNLASAALIEMGESDERMPLLLFRGAPVRFTEKKFSAKDAFFPPDQCLFRSFYNKRRFGWLVPGDPL